MIDTIQDPLRAQLQFKSEGGIIALAYECCLSNKKVPPKTVLCTTADAKVTRGSPDFAPRWSFTDPKKVTVIKSTTKAKVSLADFIIESKAVGVQNHAKLVAGKSALIPAGTVMGYGVTDAPWVDFFRAASAAAELQFFWIVKKSASSNLVVPVGVTVATAKQLILAAGGGRRIFA